MILYELGSPLLGLILNPEHGNTIFFRDVDKSLLDFIS
jgi:hypothetical protein